VVLMCNLVDLQQDINSEQLSETNLWYRL